MRVVMFMASQYGLKCYKAIKEMQSIEMVGILTTPLHFILKYEKEKSKEMDNTIYQEVVAEREINHIPIYITDKINNEETIHIVQEWNPDLIVVSGWYHIIRKEIREIPSKGIIGLHASLLPRYRGGAPLVWQLINGEAESGITLFYIDEGTDTGDIIGQKKIVVEKNDDIGTLYEKVGEEGIELLKEHIPQIACNCAPKKKQIDIEKYNIYPQRKREDGRIDWTKSSNDIYNFVRAQTRPYPGAFSMYDKYQIIIWKCKVVKIRNKSCLAGTVADVFEEYGNIYPVVATGEQGYGIEIVEYSLQPSDIDIKIKKLERFV